MLLVLTPATVSFPIALAELIVLVGGLGTMLALDLALLRRAFAPLRRLTTTMRSVDPLRPGGRAAPTSADREVAALTEAFNEMLDRLELERRDSAQRALAAQEAERRRVARELHDEVGQVLTGVVLQLDRLGRAACRLTQRADVEEAREAVRASLEDVRGIARRLRPEALDDLGLGSALAALANDVERRAGVRVDRTIDGAAGLSTRGGAGGLPGRPGGAHQRRSGTRHAQRGVEYGSAAVELVRARRWRAGSTPTRSLAVPGCAACASGPC